MKQSKRMTEIQCRLPEGIGFDTYSPGDGVTRYRFFRGDYSYFSVPGWDTIYTALGFKEAMTMAMGISAGYRAAEEREE